MASKYFSASHLLNDEVDYELKLRNYGEECSKNLDSKQRTLRRLLHQDKQENRTYRSMYSIDQEFDLISSRINTIATALSQNFDTKLVSRLIHYHLRALRSNAQSSEAKVLKDSLVKQISELVAAYRPGGQEESSQEEDNETRKSKESLEWAEQVQDDLNKSFQAASNQNSTETQKERQPIGVQDNLEVKVQNLQIQMNEIMSMLQQVLAKQQNSRTQDHSETTVQINRTGTIPKASSVQVPPPMTNDDPLEDGRGEMSLGNRFARNSVGSRPDGAMFKATQNLDQFPEDGFRPKHTIPQSGMPLQLPNYTGFPQSGYQAVNVPMNPQYGSPGRQFTSNIGVGHTRNFQGVPQQSAWFNNAGNEHIRNEPIRSPSINESVQRDYRMQHDRKIEKWNIFFSGSPRSPTLEDFIYKVKVLASMNSIPRDSLINHIHLLLRDEASNWFFTYYEANWDWNEFETRIRYRFGNPNQDQGNRQQIYERKQLKGETFIAFVTEIERLNKLLTIPLPPQRKFEIIWENMRQHYRSKLACFQICSLDQLIQVNYRIDASDPSLHPVGQKQGIHNIEVDSEEEPSEEEEINELNRRYPRAQGSQRLQEGARTRTADAARSPLCWNCRKNGHFWRDCKETKTTFCYVCGNPGKISTTCDSHPKREAARGATTTQNSGN